MARSHSAAEEERELPRGTISGVYLKAGRAEPTSAYATLADHVVVMGASPTTRQLAVALTQLRDQLRTRFDHEEGPDGLFSKVLKAAPWLEPRIDNLRREHSHICAMCDRLIADVQQRPRRATAHAVFDVLVHSLREHDDFEHALVQEASNSELGDSW